MSIISIIDCTLRDGGYLNNWQFDTNFQIKTINALTRANVDIIECGFISEQSGNDEIGTNFKSIEKVNTFLKNNGFNNTKSKFAVMMKIDEYNPDKLPPCDKIENVVSIIRVMLYKNEINQSLDKLKKIIEKGYDLHIQPTIISHYNDEEIIEMINKFNKLNYHSISLVDTFGALHTEEIKKITRIFDKFANKEAKLSLHCHNNLSKAYKNSIAFAESVASNRDIYIDSSINGLGRGAGNLQTELLITWLKTEKNMNYLVSPVKDFSLEYIQNFSRNIKEKDFYAFTITAKKNMHPNYAIWLLLQKYNRNDIQKLLTQIPPEKYETFDFQYIKNLSSAYSLSR